MKKEEMLALVIAKAKKMSKKEMEDFLGINVVKVSESFRIDCTIPINGFNNSSGGDSSKGGELYKRAEVRITNEDYNFKILNIKVKYFVPSGYGDGDMNVEPIQYTLSDQDILGIKDHGSLEYFKALFRIPTVFDNKWAKPYKLPVKNKK